MSAALLLVLQAWAEVDVPPKPEGFERLAEAGEKIYGWHCLPCHGPEGRGDGPSAQRLGLRPRDFTRGLFKLKSSPAGEPPFDDDLYRTLTVGLPVGFMPGFRKPLDPGDRWAVVAYLRTLSRPEEGPRTRVAGPPSGADAARGARLFRKDVGCAQCHGTEGKGDGPAAAEMRDGAGRPARLPDLSRGEVEFLAGARAEDVFRILTTGMEGSPMPSFASIPAQDRADLAAFVTTLYRPVDPGERLFLGKGCVACHTVGKGKHLGPDLKGVGARRTADWLRRWLKSPEEMAATDPDARKLLDEYKLIMPNPELAEDEIGALAAYLARLR